MLFGYSLHAADVETHNPDVNKTSHGSGHYSSVSVAEKFYATFGRCFTVARCPVTDDMSGL